MQFCHKKIFSYVETSQCKNRLRWSSFHIKAGCDDLLWIVCIIKNIKSHWMHQLICCHYSLGPWQMCPPFCPHYISWFIWIVWIFLSLPKCKIGRTLTELLSVWPKPSSNCCVLLVIYSLATKLIWWWLPWKMSSRCLLHRLSPWYLG